MMCVVKDRNTVGPLTVTVSASGAGSATPGSGKWWHEFIACVCVYVCVGE